MTKHTAKAGTLPNGSIDFNKVHEAAKAGKDDIYAGAVSLERNDDPPKPKDEAEAAEAQAEARPSLVAPGA